MTKTASCSEDLMQLERQACEYGLLLRLQVRRPLKLWSLRVVVAETIHSNKIRILGEVKAWAYSSNRGLQLDTIQVHSKASVGISHLLWAATMSWAIEETPCKKVRLLAICDDNHKHSQLVRYFRRKGFNAIREVGSSPLDFPLRMIWGGAGTLMVADCNEVLQRSLFKWNAFRESQVSNYSPSA